MPDITDMIAIRSSHDIPEEFVERSGPETFSVTLRSPDGTEFVPVLRDATSHEAERVKATLTRIIEQWLRPNATPSNEEWKAAQLVLSGRWRVSQAQDGTWSVFHGDEYVSGGWSTETVAHEELAHHAAFKNTGASHD
jgi:hypothetical protein